MDPSACKRFLMTNGFCFDYFMEIDPKTYLYYNPRGFLGVKSQPNQFGQITGHILKSFSMKSLLYPFRSGGISIWTIYHDMFPYMAMKKLCIKTFLPSVSLSLHAKHQWGNLNTLSQPVFFVSTQI